MEENKTTSPPPSNKETSADEAILEGVLNKSTSTPDNPQIKSTKTKSNSWVLWMVSLINLMAILTIFGGAYWLWPKYQAEQATYNAALMLAQQQSSKVESTLSERIGAVKSQMIATQNKINNQQRIQENTEQQLQDFRRSLVGLDDRRPQDWLVAEAEYLVRMATRKLYLEQDIRTAVQLLEDADAQLASLQDDNLLTLRKVLATDMQTLRSLPINSTSDIVLKLSGLLARADSLVFIQPKFEDSLEKDSLPPEASGKLAQWKSNLATSWQAIKTQFSIRQFDGKIIPQMDEQQKWWLLQRYELLLTQAQSAALHREQKLYDAYLAQAKKLVSTYFARHDVAVIGALEVITKLQTLAVEQPIPTELESLKPMQRFLEGVALQRSEQTQNKSDQ